MMKIVFRFQCAPRDDEGPVRELRGAEDDRRERAESAQDPDAQDPATPKLAAEIHVREAHHRQAGEVLHEGARLDGLHRRGARPHRAAAERSPVTARLTERNRRGTSRHPTGSQVNSTFFIYFDFICHTEKMLRKSNACLLCVDFLVFSYF